jgi:type IV pilus assembly protein PilW
MRIIMQPLNLSKQQGFTLLELLIASAIGVFISAAAAFMFVSSKHAYVETERYARVQENGRYAMQAISMNLDRIGFWSYHNGTISLVNESIIPKNSCNTEVDFPLIHSDPKVIHGLSMDRMLWSGKGSQAGTCLAPNYSKTSDVLLIRALSAQPIWGVHSGDPSIATVYDKKRYYAAMGANMVGTLRFFKGDAANSLKSGADAAIYDRAEVFQYQPYLYYIQEQTRTVGSQKIKLPVLVRQDITKTNQSIVDGVEEMRFMWFYVKNKLGTYLTSDEVQKKEPNNQAWGSVRAVKTYLLIRSELPDKAIPAIKKEYELGSDTITKKDQYHRYVMTSTINLTNMNPPSDE